MINRKWQIRVTTFAGLLPVLFLLPVKQVHAKVKAVEAVNRDHMTLVNSITASDDQVSGWIVEFIEDLENR